VISTLADRLSRLIGLSVGQRLLLGLAPALLAVILVVSLAYYGEIGRQAPEFVVTGAAVLALVSLLVTWSNTRYLAQRIRRLAGGVDALGQSNSDNADLRDSASEQDELGRIGQVVEKLGRALADSEAQRRDAVSQGQRRTQEQALVLGASVRDALARLDEVRLPLHILLDAPFGELNDNQEEMIATARAAADAMDESLRQLMTVADIDGDVMMAMIEPLLVNDVLRAVLPMIRATADRLRVRLEVKLEPALPRAYGDRARLAAALALAGADAIRIAAPDVGIRIQSGVRDREVWVRIEMEAGEKERPEIGTAARVLTGRLILAQSGRMIETAHGIELRLPLNAPETQA